MEKLVKPASRCTQSGAELVRCEIHNVEYEAKVLPLIGVVSKCPECLKELRAEQEREKQKEEQRLLQEKIRKHQDYLVQFSKVPKRYLNKTFDFSKKGGEFKEHLLSKDNLIIIGDTGTGKTFFVSEIIKQSIDKCGIYLNSNELAVLKNYRVHNILDNMEGKDLIVIDEIQVLLDNRDYFLIDLIIDKAYLNDARIILAGNVSKQALTIFKEPELKRSGSRLKDCEQLRILEFGLKDLRSQEAKSTQRDAEPLK